uniref:Uncharacterized protein n=1 Tax=Rhizophora mucronata TaxID=61149 RepID=A0A2P2Q8K7_RHIMU
MPSFYGSTKSIGELRRDYCVMYCDDAVVVYFFLASKKSRKRILIVNDEMSWRKRLQLSDFLGLTMICS